MTGPGLHPGIVMDHGALIIHNARNAAGQITGVGIHGWLWGSNTQLEQNLYSTGPQSQPCGQRTDFVHFINVSLND